MSVCVCVHAFFGWISIHDTYVCGWHTTVCMLFFLLLSAHNEILYLLNVIDEFTTKEASIYVSQNSCLSIALWLLPWMSTIYTCICSLHTLMKLWKDAVSMKNDVVTSHGIESCHKFMNFGMCFFYLQSLMEYIYFQDIKRKKKKFVSQFILTELIIHRHICPNALIDFMKRSHSRGYYIHKILLFFICSIVIKYIYRYTLILRG